MAVLRRVNFISEQRVDLPDMRSIESAASNDFDTLIESIITGTTQGYIVRGFALSMAGAIGGAASSLQLIVDPGAILHVTASQSGTFYLVPTGTAAQTLNAATNTIVQGAFVPNAINYVGLDYQRFVDDATSSQVYIWDPTTNQENTQIAPRAEILRYVVIISTTPFTSNVLPVATVTTDASNNVTSITDARWLLNRLGTGGANPNPFYVYPWTAQSEGRTENPSTSSNNSVNPFEGGDKMLFTLKDWQNAIMSSLLEIKGTPYWYSAQSAGSIVSLREDLANTVITGRGHITHSATTAGLLNWDQDINIKVIGTELTYTLTANPSSTDITLTEDEVAYITLVRGVLITPNLNFSSGSPVVTSVGSVAWTSGLASGDWIRLASATDSGYYEILTVDSSTQVTLTTNYASASTPAGGAQAAYAYGTYNASATPSGPRDIFIATRGNVPSGQNVFWLFLRTDNGGASPKIYIRFLGSEIDQGVTEEISDNKSQETLQYIGAPLESSFAPAYVSALTPGSVPQITQITLGAATTITSNQYFLIYSSDNARVYYVWFNKDGTGSDPMVPGTTNGIQVNTTTGQTNAQVASLLSTALNGTSFDDFSSVQQTNPNQNILLVTNSSAGTCNSAVNFNVGAPFSITITQSGTGIGNNVINDGDSLTLAIKKLDEAIGNILSSFNAPSYDEAVIVVASGAVPPNTINGPISSGTNITLPLNSRQGNIQQKYTVGKGALLVFLNGQYLRETIDWTEVGASESQSSQIQIQENLVVGDVLEFRISAGGGGGGSGGIGPTGPQGPQGIPGTDSFGGPVMVSSKTNNYTVLLSDNILLANCASNSITFSLPAASGSTGRIFNFKKIDSTSNSMTILANGSDLIDGFSTLPTTVQYQAFTIATNGTEWYIL